MEFIENKTVELKEKYVDSIKKESVAFCNTNGGVIYIGITDDGNVIGVDSVDDTMQKITNSLRDSITPDMMVFVSVENVKISDFDVVKITIAEGTRKPYYLSEKGLKPSGVYVREGVKLVMLYVDCFLLCIYVLFLFPAYSVITARMYECLKFLCTSRTEQLC